MLGQAAQVDWARTEILESMAESQRRSKSDAKARTGGKCRKLLVFPIQWRNPQSTSNSTVSCPMSGWSSTLRAVCPPKTRCEGVSVYLLFSFPNVHIQLEIGLCR
ncbi:hypothetical protein RRG08_030157 [Elysia crispata]|uniref:Uncharacterized protein n=1 Tax=Elysia crispata TaxID=231223 RepID=A0AAE1DLC7_9GAST|nr:hypothetical protein RRG08_030157 [Elysia crispata]